MTSPSAPTTTPVDWSIQSVSIGGLTIPVARLNIPLFLGGPPATLHSPCDLCWLDTGAPVSVVPFHVHHGRLSWRPVPGVSTTWAGQPCDLGHVNVWLTTEQPPTVRGPFSLLAKFPRADPPGDLVPILLGLEFFFTHQADFDMVLPPKHSVIRLP